MVSTEGPYGTVKSPDEGDRHSVCVSCHCFLSVKKHRKQNANDATPPHKPHDTRRQCCGDNWFC